MKTLSLRLPEALDAQLTALARERGVSRSALARQAIEGLVNGNGGKPAVSCYDLTKNLAGCFDGPPDLATNKKYMEGFGK